MPLKFECPGCHKDIIVQYLSKGETARCRHCLVEVTVPEDAEEITGSEVQEYARKLQFGPERKSTLQRPYDPYGLEMEGRGKIVFLKVMGWIILVGGCLSGMMTMIIGFAGPPAEDSLGAGGVFMGLVLIINSLALFALFTVVASIADHMILMQRYLSKEERVPVIKSEREPDTDFSRPS
ncbi:MAG TPA: hypothetical protein ENO22_13280 [candidate division Zixibacteria bacterium]|nr:hypothetical protein [candidate division Zixibacteria bacterium]